jgi:hypothetical protein
MSGRRDAERTTLAQSTALAEVARFPEMNRGPALRVQGDQGTVLLANESARKVSGDELVGRGWHNICPGIPLLGAIARAASCSSSAAILRANRTPNGCFAEVAGFPEMNPGPVLREVLLDPG